MAASFKIGFKIFEQAAVVFDAAKKSIATCAEDSPDSSGRVAVVNAEAGFRRSAHFAFFTSIPKEFVRRFGRQPIVSFEHPAAVEFFCLVGIFLTPLFEPGITARFVFRPIFSAGFRTAFSAVASPRPSLMSLCDGLSKLLDWFCFTAFAANFVRKGVIFYAAIPSALCWL